MDFKVERSAPNIVRVSGELDLTNVAGFQEAMEEILTGSGEGLIVDMTNLAYVDSAGIAALLAAYQRLRASGRKMAIVTVEGNVKRILMLTHLESLPGFILCEDQASAEQALLRNG